MEEVEVEWYGSYNIDSVLEQFNEYEDFGLYMITRKWGEYPEKIQVAVNNSGSLSQSIRTGNIEKSHAPKKGSYQKGKAKVEIQVYERSFNP